MNEKTILLVEDDPDDEALTLRALRKGQIRTEVVVARDGREALDRLSTGLRPAVVLLDLKLPKIDGLEVLRRIRDSEKTRRLPVVILTSSKEERDLRKSYDLGANSYIRKPVDFTRFAETVRGLEIYWVDFNEPPPERPG